MHKYTCILTPHTENVRKEKENKIKKKKTARCARLSGHLSGLTNPCRYHRVSRVTFRCFLLSITSISTNKKKKYLAKRFFFFFGRWTPTSFVCLQASLAIFHQQIYIYTQTSVIIYSARYSKFTLCFFYTYI